MANAAETPLQHWQPCSWHWQRRRVGLQAVWVTPDPVHFEPTPWDMLLVFLCVRSKGTLCHCSKVCDSPWCQVSSGITGLTCRYESGDSLARQTAKELSYPTNISLETSEVEQAAMSCLN